MIWTAVSNVGGDGHGAGGELHRRDDLDRFWNLLWWRVFEVGGDDHACSAGECGGDDVLVVGRRSTPRTLRVHGICLSALSQDRFRCCTRNADSDTAQNHSCRTGDRVVADSETQAPTPFTSGAYGAANSGLPTGRPAPRCHHRPRYSIVRGPVADGRKLLRACGAVRPSRAHAGGRSPTRNRAPRAPLRALPRCQWL